MVDRVTRFGVSIPGSLAKKFDESVKNQDYANRSKAIQDAITEFIKENAWLSEDGIFVGTLSYVYDHHMGNVTERLTGLQHHENAIIKSVMHAHIDHDTCVEVLIISGKRKNLQDIYNKIKVARGVKNAKLAVLETLEGD